MAKLKRPNTQITIQFNNYARSNNLLPRNGLFGNTHTLTHAHTHLPFHTHTHTHAHTHTHTHTHTHLVMVVPSWITAGQ